jgi:hypothetical protein
LEQPDLGDHPVVERDLMLVLLDLRDRLDLLDPLVWVAQVLGKELLDLRDRLDHLDSLVWVERVQGLLDHRDRLDMMGL